MPLFYGLQGNWDLLCDMTTIFSDLLDQESYCYCSGCKEVLRKSFWLHGNDVVSVAYGAT